MPRVRTVSGDVDVDEIGITLIHEHPYMVEFETQLAELKTFRQQGGSCVVDQTSTIERNPSLLKRLADESGLHVVASTGFYREESHPEGLRRSETDAIAEIMVREIEDHVEGGDFRAGLIGEIGVTEYGTTPQEMKVLRASARAQKATGVPLSIHTMGGAEALFVIGLLQEEGVDPARVIIDHIDLDHVEHLRLVADKGVYLGFDTIGKERYRDDGLRLEVLCAMVGEGHEDQIVISYDISKPDYLRANGGHGYEYLLGEFVARMREKLSETIIQKLLITNPRRVLAF